MKKKNPAKELYQSLRARTCEQLWTEDVPRFDRATARERVAGVAVVRAVGVVFSESGNAHQIAQARRWLRSLLRDSEEKVRRYAMVALPKLGGSEDEEADLLAFLARKPAERELRALGRTLEKIGGAATLRAAGGPAGSSLGRAAQKAAANLARTEGHGIIRLDRTLNGGKGFPVCLHCRSGLEDLLTEEIRENGRCRVTQRGRGRLLVTPTADFALADLYTMRCFSAVGFSLGAIPEGSADRTEEAIATAISAASAWRIFRTFTDGPVRYRLEVSGRGHQRSLVRRISDAVYRRRPDLLNDSRNALWQVDIAKAPAGWTVEVRPRLRPDPRFAYRRGDVPAASHPPLAAAMARLAGPGGDERVWDPFCGSGLELIECGLRGGVAAIFGSDVSAEALAVTRTNLAAAQLDGIRTHLVEADFREFARGDAARAGITLIVTNPPMGRRVPIANLEGLLGDLFSAAARTLQPGGRLVLANPRAIGPTDRNLRRVARQKVDLGGFHVFLEKYVKVS